MKNYVCACHVGVFVPRHGVFATQPRRRQSRWTREGDAAKAGNARRIFCQDWWTQDFEKIRENAEALKSI